MQIAKDTVVQIHYTLRDDAGEIIDSSSGKDPLTYLQGHGNLIPGLEVALEGKSSGAHEEVVIAPEHGYGLHDEQLVQQVPRSAFSGVEKIEVGMRFHAGPQDVVVTRIDGDTITIDANHALAGATLHFSVDIVHVRAATREELEHGHVHGPGGHHH